MDRLAVMEFYDTCKHIRWTYIKIQFRFNIFRTIYTRDCITYADTVQIRVSWHKTIRLYQFNDYSMKSVQFEFILANDSIVIFSIDLLFVFFFRFNIHLGIANCNRTHIESTHFFQHHKFHSKKSSKNPIWKIKLKRKNSDRTFKNERKWCVDLINLQNTIKSPDKELTINSIKIQFNWITYFLNEGKEILDI